MNIVEAYKHGFYKTAEEYGLSPEPRLVKSAFLKRVLLAHRYAKAIRAAKALGLEIPALKSKGMTGNIFTNDMVLAERASEAKRLRKARNVLSKNPELGTSRVVPDPPKAPSDDKGYGIGPWVTTGLIGGGLGYGYMNASEEE